jgi:hypothetical protein
VPGAMSVPTLYVPLASMVVFGAGAGAGAGSAWAIPTAAQMPATVNAAATAVAFVDLMTVQFSRPNHRTGNPGRGTGRRGSRERHRAATFHNRHSYHSCNFSNKMRSDRVSGNDGEGWRCGMMPG